MSDYCAIFDWDGVLIDSAGPHERSWELLAGEEGLFLPADHFKLGFGKKNQLIIPHILHWTDDPAEIERLSERKEELYREIVAGTGVVILPGARELLQALRDAGIPRALGSSTPRSNLDALFAVTGLDRLLDAVVCGNDVVNGKPAPDVFLKAAGLLHADPARCVVFEDALFGVEAARRGGMKVVAVTTTNPREALRHADLVIDSLLEVTPGSLRGLFA